MLTCVALTDADAWLLYRLSPGARDISQFDYHLQLAEEQVGDACYRSRQGCRSTEAHLHGQHLRQRQASQGNVLFVWSTRPLDNDPRTAIERGIPNSILYTFVMLMIEATTAILVILAQLPNGTKMTALLPTYPMIIWCIGLLITGNHLRRHPIGSPYKGVALANGSHQLRRHSKIDCTRSEQRNKSWLFKTVAWLLKPRCV